METPSSSLGAASCEHGNRYDGEGLSFFKNSSGRNSNIWIYNCLNLIDLSLKNVLLMARSWWTGRKRRRPEDEGAPVVHVFQDKGRRRLKRKGTGGGISVAPPTIPFATELFCFVLQVAGPGGLPARGVWIVTGTQARR